jgi:hypothetical protein
MVRQCEMEAIASKFAHELGRLPDVYLIAVASHRPERAEEFGDKYGVPAGRRYVSFEQLATVGLVHVAFPNSVRHEHTLLFLNAGRGLLCEKPFALAPYRPPRCDHRTGARTVSHGGDVEPLPAHLRQTPRTGRRRRYRHRALGRTPNSASPSRRTPPTASTPPPAAPC